MMLPIGIVVCCVMYLLEAPLWAWVAYCAVLVIQKARGRYGDGIPVRRFFS